MKRKTKELINYLVLDAGLIILLGYLIYSIVTTY